jgi:quinol-cytochrome oxidoreductase complex cytochrome b subunit
MNKVIGYGISFVGLIIISIGFGDFSSGVPLLNLFSSGVITLLGVIFVVVGVVLSLMDGSSGKPHQETKEVPIYKGVGKNRKIVGYQRS